jgi:jumonji domain-containing protein 7
MHKDHYENLFYVLHGEKVFTICPPADAAFLYEREFKMGVFVPQEDWNVRLVEDDLVRWIEPDIEVLLQGGEPKASLLREFPLLKYAHPHQVHVRAGEMLYLPSLWFHRVTQTCETVRVNYWFDMKFDSPNWCYFHLLQQLQLEKVQDGDE